MDKKFVKIRYDNGMMECLPEMFIGIPLAKFRKLFAPYMLNGVNDVDKRVIIDTLYNEYTERVAAHEKGVENFYKRITEICTACGMEAPEKCATAAETKADYNWKVNISKLPRVDSIPAPPAEFGACMVPITRRNDNGVLECYAGKGYGALIDGVPVYAQRVKTGLYIFNACGASAPVIQWHSKAEAAEGIAAALATAKRRGGKQFDEFMNNIRQFMDIPAAAPEAVKPEAPEAVKPAEISAAVDNTAAEIVPAAAPAETTPAPRKATRRAAPDFVGKTMTAYPRKPKAPEAPKSKPKNKRRNPAEFVGRKMVITIGERAARPAAD